MKSLILWLVGLLILAWGMAASPGSARHYTLFIAGDFQGNLAPCGCSSPMLGGIQRLGSALDQVPRSQRVFLINGGLLKETPAENIALQNQEPLKAETMAESFGSLGVAAINLGSEEYSRGFGVVEAVNRLSNGKLISASYANAGVPSGTISGPFAIFGMSEVEPAGIEAARRFKGSKRLLVMLRGDAAAAMRLASALPEAELIVYRSLGTPPDPIRVGQALLVSPGSEGRALIRIEDDGRLLGQAGVITLTPDFKNQSSVADIYHSYLHRVESKNLLALWPREKTSAFAGTDACIKCHVEEGKVWAKSAHAHAYPDLIQQGHGRDPDCVICHVTGLSSTRGF